jgi:tRNA-specific 2-thiouridylase
VGGGLPFYVVGKDMAANEVQVTTQLDDDRLWHRNLQLTDLHWINDAPQPGHKYQVRTRYRAPLVGCELLWEIGSPKGAPKGELVLDEDIRAIAPGQSAVMYDGDRVVGGGIVV